MFSPCHAGVTQGEYVVFQATKARSIRVIRSHAQYHGNVVHRQIPYSSRTEGF
jgi:hypothetical protein